MVVMSSKNFKIRETDYGAISVFPLPSPGELAEFYAETYYQKTSSNSSYEHEYSEEEISHRRLRADLMLYALGKVSTLFDDGLSLLEVGCGEGFLLKAASEKGYHVNGIDFSRFAVHNMHSELVDKIEFGDAYNILQGYFVDGRRFGVCVMQNVLEHVVDPPGLLEKTKNILEPCGIVAVTVPNDYSDLQKTAKELGVVDEEYWFTPPEHLYYFNIDSIRKIAAHCGYELVDMFADFPIDMFLFHPGTNYVKDRSKGKNAHHARLRMDLLLAARGMEAYHSFYQALAVCGMGRNITVLMRPLSNADI